MGLFFLGMLVLLGAKVNWGVGIVQDIHLQDETVYLWKGLDLDLSAPQMSPLYRCWYYFLSLFEPDRLDLYYLNWFLLPLIMAVGVYLLIRSLGAPALLAFASASAVLLSQVFNAWPRPMHFAVSLVLIGLAIAFAFRSTATRLAVATLVMGIAWIALTTFISTAGNGTLMLGSPISACRTNE